MKLTVFALSFLILALESLCGSFAFANTPSSLPNLRDGTSFELVGECEESVRMASGTVAGSCQYTPTEHYVGREEGIIGRADIKLIDGVTYVVPQLNLGLQPCTWGPAPCARDVEGIPFPGPGVLTASEVKPEVSNGVWFQPGKIALTGSTTDISWQGSCSKAVCGYFSPMPSEGLYKVAFANSGREVTVSLYTTVGGDTSTPRPASGCWGRSGTLRCTFKGQLP